ncbi:DNA-binding protein, partial [Bacillus thuringiensis]
LKNEVSKLREYSEKQEEFNKLLIEQLQKQQDYIDNKLEKRDQKLLETIREVQETKSLTASTESKGFFARLFGK